VKHIYTPQAASNKVMLEKLKGKQTKTVTIAKNQASGTTSSPNQNILHAIRKSQSAIPTPPTQVQPPQTQQTQLQNKVHQQLKQPEQGLIAKLFNWIFN
jgi:hypothetical protein